MQFEASLPLNSRPAAKNSALYLPRTEPTPSRIRIAASLCHPLTRGFTSWSGAGCTVRFNPARFGCLSYLRVTLIPQRRATLRGDLRQPGQRPDVIEDVSDVSAVGDVGNAAHLATRDWAQWRKNLIDTSNQHRPQVVRWAFGLYRAGRGCDSTALRCQCGRALARGDWLGRCIGRLRRCCQSQCRHRSFEWRVRCQHLKVSVAVRTWWRH